MASVRITGGTLYRIGDAGAEASAAGTNTLGSTTIIARAPWYVRWNYYFPGNIGSSSMCGLQFYQGTRPTQSELNTGFPVAATSGANTYTLATLPRNTDLLCHLTMYSFSEAIATNTLTAFQLSGTAIRSGTATWFQLLVVHSGGYDFNVITGSVSAVGGGGDIELLTTTFVSGGVYKFPAIGIPLPTKFVV